MLDTPVQNVSLMRLAQHCKDTSKSWLFRAQTNQISGLTMLEGITLELHYPNSFPSKDRFCLLVLFFQISHLLSKIENDSI